MSKTEKKVKKDKIEFNKNNDVIVNGSNINSNLGIQQPFSDQYLCISLRRGSGTERKGRFKYFYVKIWDKNVLIRDLVPSIVKMMEL